MNPQSKLILNKRKVICAITPYQGANLNHDGEQKFWMLFGACKANSDEVAFKRGFSFSFDETYKIDFGRNKIQCAPNDRGTRLLISSARIAVFNSILSKEGERIWGSDLPTPTELVEVYFNKKAFMFCFAETRSDALDVIQIENWSMQLRREALCD